MQSRNTLWALAAGLAFGGLAFILLYQKASEIERRSTPQDVLVAAKFIPPHTHLKPGLVIHKSIPEAFVNPGTLTDLHQVEGLVSLVPLSAGEQIQANKFGRSGETLSWALEPGFRAFTLAVDESTGVGGLLHPGDRVDLLVKGTLGGRETAGFLYQNLGVLAVGGQTASPDGPPAEDTHALSGAYNHVTLSVSPEQAETLFFLASRSVLSLVLRGEGDETEVHLPALGESELYQKLSKTGGKSNNP
jgi:pilus assembly protein CpaB